LRPDLLSSRAVPDDTQLENEARLFTRYLVGREAHKLVARYRDASRALFYQPANAAETAVVAYVHRHPWSLPFLEAASALLRPGSLLRNKVLMMGAILETSAAIAEEFLPRNVSLAGLVLRVLAGGTAAVVRTLLGAPLLAAASRSHARG
jgi:hypothetical protein